MKRTHHLIEETTTLQVTRRRVWLETPPSARPSRVVETTGTPVAAKPALTKCGARVIPFAARATRSA